MVLHFFVNIIDVIIVLFAIAFLILVAFVSWVREGIDLVVSNIRAGDYREALLILSLIALVLSLVFIAFYLLYDTYSFSKDEIHVKDVVSEQYHIDKKYIDIKKIGENKYNITMPLQVYTFTVCYNGEEVYKC